MLLDCIVFCCLVSVDVDTLQRTGLPFKYILTDSQPLLHALMPLHETCNIVWKKKKKKETWDILFDPMSINDLIDLTPLQRSLHCMTLSSIMLTELSGLQACCRYQKPTCAGTERCQVYHNPQSQHATEIKPPTHMVESTVYTFKFQ